MPARPPFVDPATGDLNTKQILSEAMAIVKLAGLFVALSLVPLTPLVFDVGASGTGEILVLLAQFVLAVGAAIVLIYVVARGIQLSGEP